jgi:hypothetical protein
MTNETVLSPFLPGTQIQYAWDSTSLGYLKTCPRLYQYIMIDGWSEKQSSVHLKFGIEYHKALEEYDDHRLKGQSHEDALNTTIHALLARIHDWDVDTSTRAGNYKNHCTLLQLVIDYLDKYKDDPAQTVIRENGEAATELSFRFELDWGPQAAYVYPKAASSFSIQNGDSTRSELSQPYILSGHLDRVVNFNDSILVMDRKTTTTTPGAYYMDQWSPNNQMSLYTLAGQVVLNTAVKGVIIDAAQVLLDKPNNYVRGFTYRTPDQTKEWLDDLKFWLHSAENYATIGYWPMNDTACDKFGGCRFRGVCSKDPSVRERFLEADFIKLPSEERWNPLKPR